MHLYTIALLIDYRSLNKAAKDSKNGDKQKDNHTLFKKSYLIACVSTLSRNYGVTSRWHGINVFLELFN